MPPRLLLMLVLVLAATSLSAAGPASAQEAPNPPDPYIVGGDAQRALDRARAKWKGAKIRSYGYAARRTCFCPTTGWHVVNVRKGSPSRKVHADVKEIATVPRLFRAIQQAIDREAHDLTVTYSRYGVPSRISIDTYENVVDEEQIFTVRRFKRR